MAVFRVERNTGYTVMSNHHLRNKELSLKAKGLLSQMLSLPEDWDYTLAGLSYINRESIDAIRTAVWELEKAGYITRRQGRDEKGKMTAIEYTIYEQPQPPELDCPVLEKPTADNPILENPTTDNPTSENPTQLNKDISRTNLPKKEKSNTDLSITHSIPIHSLNPLPYDGDEAAEPPERKRTERNDAYRVYEEIIKDNIAYDILLQDRSLDRDRLNEIVDLMLETVCTARKKIRIAGDDYPAELVKSKFMKLNSEHIRFVLDCIFLFGGTLSLASALDKTGAGAEIANIVIGALGENPSPYVLTLVVFLLCCVMTNFMSNTATTALMVPICLSIAQGMGADPRAVLMACVIGGSCAYATPIGMPANTMVVSAGGYTFKDYAKAGLPLILIATVVSMVILPIAFPFFPQ